MIEDAKEGQITDYFATFGNWKWISETTARLTKDTKFQANVAAEPSLIQLLVAGLSPFELACLPNTPENIEIFDLLLEHTNMSHFSKGNPVFSGYSPLHLTAGVGSWPDGGSVKKLQRLLEAGAGPDSPLVTWSPLGYHILQDSTDTAETLIEAGADIWSSVPGLYDGPLAAMAGGHLSLLFKMAEYTTAKGLVPQWDRTCTVTIGDRDVSGINALHLAAASDRVECLELYLNRGLLTDLEARDDRQETPVHYAVRFGNVSVLERLKNHGADINSSSASGETPLHLAVRGQHLDAVKALIKLGAKHQACSGGVSSDHLSRRARFDMAELSSVAREWLLVSRYTEQLKLASGPWDEGRCIENWDGVVLTEVEVEWYMQADVSLEAIPHTEMYAAE
ncbi:hypothetical protein NW759_015232 [Fusarium solani]|nr:hypothetical protein NW759_015232 [Fusarium solani]